MRAPARSTPFLLLLALVALPRADAAEGKRLDLAVSGYVQIDPAILRSQNEERMVNALFEGLTTLDPATGKAAPGAAASWTQAADGRSWTFKIRDGAAWSDGKPLTAKHFVFAWKRMVDPINRAPQAVLFRPLRGLAALQEADAAVEAIDRLSKGLRELAEQHPSGIPGSPVTSLVAESGARPYVERVSNDVRAMLRMKDDDVLSESKATQALKDIRGESRKHREVLDKALDAFGTASGVLAPDDKTLVVETEGWCPWLPELVARAAFSPLREDVLASQREAAFEPGGFVGNGPFRLKGRGAKPRPGLEKPDSVVHVVKNEKYVGPNAAVLDEVYCWTDMGVAEERRRFDAPVKSLQWMATPSREARKELEKDPAYRTRAAGSALYLVVRCDKEPFEKREARLAFALSVDRAALAKLLWPAGEPAERLVPPGVRGVQPGVSAPKASPAAAKEAAKAAGAKLQDTWIEVLHADEDTAADVARALGEAWTTAIGIETAPHVDVAGERSAAFGPNIGFVLRETIGDWNDPAAYLESFHSRHPGNLGRWKDEALDLMLDGTSNPQAAIDGAEKILAVAKDAAALRAKIDAGKTGTESAREALRQALLAEAEQRLLSEAVVIPIAFPRRAELLQDVKGLGEEEAWKNPAFVGCLRSAKR